jgi:methionine sulfoxide reductase heme-binding subunit
VSASYKAISWNKYKIRYDAFLWSACLLYIGGFIAFNLSVYPAYNVSTAIIRGFGTLAILLLHVVLFIGPAARLNSKWLPLLYNRRHLGVTTFIIAAAHGIFSLIWYHGNGNKNPLLSVFESNTHYGSLIFFPFQTLGVAALLILAAMAFTSHDFWLSFLGPGFWKSMHMLVYVAYFLIMMHVALGIIQLEKSPWLVLVFAIGMVIIITTHLLAGYKEITQDKINTITDGEGWIYVGKVEEIPESRAKIVLVNGERVAVFRYNGKLSAVHNVCKHQLGPLGEGKVVDGCITCPWHGYQYRPEDGCAPAPFTEKIHTYLLKMQDDGVYVQQKPLAEGTYVEPLVIQVASQGQADKSRFFVGWNSGNARSIYLFCFRTGLWLALLIIFVGLFLSTQQKELSPFAIDYDHVEEIRGWLLNKPIPILRIIETKESNGSPRYKNILLVDGFKHGAEASLLKFLGNDSVRYVRLKGYSSHKIISCGKPGRFPCDSACSQCIAGTMLFPLMELENGSYSLETEKEPMNYQAENLIDHGVNEITGEILDAKCYLGAMNPGYGKVHMSCAIRCISGGIMPIIVYKEKGIEKFAVLLDRQGEAINKKILGSIGIKSTVKGHFYNYGNWEIVMMEEIQSINHPSKSSRDLGMIY